MKFGFNQPIGFWGEDVWKCWHTHIHTYIHTDIRTTEPAYTISSPYEPIGSGELMIYLTMPWIQERTPVCFPDIKSNYYFAPYLLLLLCGFVQCMVWGVGFYCGISLESSFCSIISTKDISDTLNLRNCTNQWSKSCICCKCTYPSQLNKTGRSLALSRRRRQRGYGEETTLRQTSRIYLLMLCTAPVMLSFYITSPENKETDLEIIIPRFT